MSTKSIIATLAFKFNKKGNQTSSSRITAIEAQLHYYRSLSINARSQFTVIVIRMHLSSSCCCCCCRHSNETVKSSSSSSSPHHIKCRVNISICWSRREFMYQRSSLFFWLQGTRRTIHNGDLLNFYPKENCLFNHSVIRSVDDIITATYSYATMDGRLWRRRRDRFGARS